MNSVVLVLHLLVAIGLIGLVLMQRSEGGALGVGGGSSSLISGRGAADVMARSTGILAVVFFVTSISLTMMAGGQRPRSVVEEADTPAWYETIIPKDLFTPKTAPVPAVKPPSPAITAPALATPAPAPVPEVIPPPTEAITRAGPIDATPLPLAGAKPSTVAATDAPRVAIVNPKPAVKPVAEAPVAPAASAKPAPTKPVVRAPKPAPVQPAESVEAPAAPPSRAGPDE